MASAPKAAELTAAIIDTHLRLDAAISSTLGDLVVNTEASAVDSIQRVRKLSDSAEQLVGLLRPGNSGDGDLNEEISTNLEHLSEVGAFIDELPQRIQRDADTAELLSKEMKDMSELVEAVKSISIQSHMLAINTAIQAANAGPLGAAFGVMAAEMRALANHSKTVSTQIIAGLTRTRETFEQGIGSNISRSAQELERVSDAAASIDQLRRTLAQLQQQNAERLAGIARHNELMARDIADILGHLQYQDIVRQSIDRVRAIMQSRNECITHALPSGEADLAALAQVPRQLDLILENYVSTESAHTRAALNQVPEASAPKIELF